MSAPAALRIAGPFPDSELVLDMTLAGANSDLIASLYQGKAGRRQQFIHSLVFTYCPLTRASLEDGGQADAPLLWLDHTCLAIPREHIQAVTDYLLAARQAAAIPAIATVPACPIL